MLAEILFIIDTVGQFHVGFFDPNEHTIIMDRSIIRARYLKTNFAFDALGSIGRLIANIIGRPLSGDVQVAANPSCQADVDAEQACTQYLRLCASASTCSCRDVSHVMVHGFCMAFASKGAITGLLNRIFTCRIPGRRSIPFHCTPGCCLCLGKIWDPRH